jgi:hypothetical protein
VACLYVGRISGQGTPSRRTAEGKPNFTGIWQALNEANWDVQGHAALPARVTQPGVWKLANGSMVDVPAAPFVALGAVAGVPASLGVVQGDGQIPYKPAALAIKKANYDNWIDRDPELKCYLPGLPRAMYMPYPFQIIQGNHKVVMSYAYGMSGRTIYLDPIEDSPNDSFYGHSVGKWEGDTLVVTVTHFNGKAWFDRAGNFASDALKLTERYTPLSQDAINYEVTIEDPNTFTRPWKIAMPLYRRLEPNMTLLEYQCIPFAEEFLYGNLRKEQLVKHWEGETLAIDITRKVPPPDKLYDWYRK